MKGCESMESIHGIAASSGIAMAKAYHLETPDLTYEKKSIENSEGEIKRLDDALALSKTKLDKIRDHTKKERGDEYAEIVSAHLLFIEDPELINQIKDKITKEQVNAEVAIDEKAKMYIDMIKNMDIDYMKERAADIKDVTERVMAHLLGVNFPNPALIDEEVIVIANDLNPSDTAQLNRQFVKGFATDIGGRTSHSAIMARSLEIPAVVGSKEVTNKIKQNDVVIVDGIEGTVIV